MRYLHHCYRTLEVDHNASFEEIHQSYKDLVMVWHPDRFVHNPRLYNKAQEKIKQLNGAYEELRLRWTSVMASVSSSWKPKSSRVDRSSPVSQARTREYNRTLDDYIRHHSQDMQNWLD